MNSLRERNLNMKKPTLAIAIILGLTLLCSPAALAVTPEDIVVVMEPSLEFDYMFPAGYGMVAIYKDNTWGIIDVYGNIVVPLEYDWAWTFDEGLLCVKRDNNWGVLDANGNTVLPIEFT